MEKTFELEIITPNEVFFKGTITDLNCDTTEGRLEILANHSAVIAGIVPSITKIIDEQGNEVKISTGKGILKVRNNSAVVLCDEAKNI